MTNAMTPTGITAARQIPTHAKLMIMIAEALVGAEAASKTNVRGTFSLHDLTRAIRLSNPTWEIEHGSIRANAPNVIAQFPTPITSSFNGTYRQYNFDSGAPDVLALGAPDDDDTKYQLIVIEIS